MDRLSALIVVVVVVVGAAGCGDSKPAAPGARGNPAQTAPKQGHPAKAFCDVHATADTAKLLEWPALTSSPPTSTGSTWRWINVWATWCPPCVEEMPRIAKWRDQLVTPTRPLEVSFISVDDSDADIAELRAAHPAIPASLRLAKPDDSPAWFGRLGLDSAAPLPIHIFVDDRNRVRCVRAAAIRDTDYAAVAKLLAE